MNKLIVDVQDLNAVLRYLFNKPYVEVYQLIPGLINLPEYKEPTTTVGQEDEEKAD